MPSTWPQLLDAYEVTIMGVEQALAEGEELPALTSFARPAEPPSDAPEPEHVARFEALQARARACSERIRAGMTRTAEELGTSRRTGAAARAYVGVDQLTG